MFLASFFFFFFIIILMLSKKKYAPILQALSCSYDMFLTFDLQSLMFLYGIYHSF